MVLLLRVVGGDTILETKKRKFWQVLNLRLGKEIELVVFVHCTSPVL